MSVSPVPEGYRSVIPYLVVDDATAAINFYVEVFGANEVMRMEKDGTIGHAELAIGDSHIMLADEHPGMGYLSPKTIGGQGIGTAIMLSTTLSRRRIPASQPSPIISPKPSSMTISSRTCG